MEDSIDDEQQEPPADSEDAIGPRAVEAEDRQTPVGACTLAASFIDPAREAKIVLPSERAWMPLLVTFGLVLLTWLGIALGVDTFRVVTVFVKGWYHGGTMAAGVANTFARVSELHAIDTRIGDSLIGIVCLVLIVASLPTIAALSISFAVASLANGFLVGAGFGRSIVDRAVAVVRNPLGRRRAALLHAGLVVLLAILQVIELAEFRRQIAGMATSNISIFGDAWNVILVAGVLIALIATVGLLIWSLAELKALREFPGCYVAQWTASSEVKPELTVAHLSDLHLGPDAETPRTEGGEPVGNDGFARLVSERMNELANTDAILITGDITDAGRPGDWASFFNILGDLRSRAVILPGNHDVNIADAYDRMAVETEDGHGLARRRLRMLAAMDMVQGDRTFLLWEGKQLELRAFLKRRADKFKSMYDFCDSNEVNELWPRLFPMVVKLPNGFVLHIFDSNARLSTIVTNAFGRIDGGALTRFGRLAAGYPRRSHLVALHHQLGYPSEVREQGAGAAIMKRFLTLHNALQFVKTLNVFSNVVIFHGHRHMMYNGRIDDRIDVVSAGSSTLGDALSKGPRRPGFRVLGIAKHGNGTTLVSSRDVIVN